jgi:hypothetical protein
MTKSPDLPDFPAAFVQHFAAACGPPLPASLRRARGRPAVLPPEHIVAGLAWHVLQTGGTFAGNMALLGSAAPCDSTLSHRRQALGTRPWVDAMDTLLKPLAEQQSNPHAFYKGMRLLGVDGTTLNVANTPSIKSSRLKTRSRRGTAAFHRIGCAALVELGTHSPVAVRVAEHNESEGALAAELIHKLQADDLLVADRLYGCGKWAGQLMILPSQPHFLIRVPEHFKSKCIRTLRDGSKLVEILDHYTGETLLLRQVKASIRRPGRRWVKVRYWTNLLDCTDYPARELVDLYAMRWEQEIAFKELKCQLQEDNLLRSHTHTTAVQEVCSLFIAQAIVAALRSDAASYGDVPVMQVSFARTLDACRMLCWFSVILGNRLPPEILLELRASVRLLLAQRLSGPRRHRSCPRMVRQPIHRWHRLMKNSYQSGAIKCRIRK